MLTNIPLDLACSPDFASSGGGDALAERVLRLERQNQRLCDEHYRLLQSVKTAFDTLNREGALQIADATIDGTPIGAASASTGAFTTLAASGLISANGGQVKFPATQNASADLNTLDDYEEDPASQTLTVTFATPGTSSFASTENNYTSTKFGREVLVRFNIVGTITIGSGSGALKLTGLPYTSANVTSNYAVGALVWGDSINRAGMTQMQAIVPPNSSAIQFDWSGVTKTADDVNAADITTATTLRLRGFVVYHV
jgi:hypothetical protein